MPQERFSFHRPELAVDLCNSLEGKGLSDASSGMFLAAPRRTGKSTFLHEDLLPEMKRRGWIATYVDLWSDQTRDPRLDGEAHLIDTEDLTVEFRNRFEDDPEIFVPVHQRTTSVGRILQARRRSAITQTPAMEASPVHAGNVPKGDVEMW